MVLRALRDRKAKICGVGGEILIEGQERLPGLQKRAHVVLRICESEWNIWEGRKVYGCVGAG